MYVPILYKVKMELLYKWANVLLDITSSKNKKHNERVALSFGGMLASGVLYRPQTLHAVVNDLGQCSRT